MQKNHIISMEHVPQHGHSAAEAVAADANRQLLAACGHVEAAHQSARQASTAYRRLIEPPVTHDLGFSAAAQPVPNVAGTVYETEPKPLDVAQIEQQIYQAFADDKPNYHIEHPRDQQMDQAFKDLGYRSNVAA